MIIVEELIKSIDLKIDEIPELCDFKWNIKNKLDMNSDFTKFTITTNFTCSLQGFEKISLTILDPTIITDYYYNTLITLSFNSKALRYKYISSAEQAATDASGKAFSITSIITLLLIIGINLLQSAAVGSFWSFINMAQILFYVPVINVNPPANLKAFLSGYLTCIKLAVPIKSFPNWIPNPLVTLAPFITSPFNSRFFEIGYETSSFIYNFAEELITWVIVVFTYALLCFLDYIIPEGSYFFDW